MHEYGGGREIWIPPPGFVYKQRCIAWTRYNSIPIAERAEEENNDNILMLSDSTKNAVVETVFLSESVEGIPPSRVVPF